MVYGIDFGTTYTRMAKLNWNNEPELIMDPWTGKQRIASAVFISEDGTVVVGDEAKELGLDNPERLFQFFKRSIGRNDHQNRDRYIIDGREYDPVELASFVIREMVMNARDAGEEIRDVVITYPADYNCEQKEAIVKACEIIGLNVVKAVNDITAIMTDYYYKHRGEFTKNVVIYNLGSSSFDVTVGRFECNWENAGFETLEFKGDSGLGGVNWDNELYWLLLEKCRDEHGLDLDSLQEDLKALIHSKVEHLKKRLSVSDKAKMRIPYNGEKIIIEVTRDEFECATVNYVHRTIDLLNSVLQEANMADDDIDVILMVGSSTNMPMIHKALSDRFGEKVICDHPNNAIVRGAVLCIDYAVDPSIDIHHGYRRVCSNCKKEFIEGDTYCRYCGAKLSEAFIPINDSFGCIYGPAPIHRQHICSKCGFTWDTKLMIDQQKHCPKCGERVGIIENNMENMIRRSLGDD